jgi:hypothetical protein
MPGTGPLRRSSAPARKKAIVGKSRVEPELLQSPAFVFLLFLTGLRFQAAAFNSRSSVFALEVLLMPTRRHVDTVLHLVICGLRAMLLLFAGRLWNSLGTCYLRPLCSEDLLKPLLSLCALADCQLPQ